LVMPHRLGTFLYTYMYIYSKTQKGKEKRSFFKGALWPKYNI
jgi:hypothetical protein